MQKKRTEDIAIDFGFILVIVHVDHGCRKGCHARGIGFITDLDGVAHQFPLPVGWLVLLNGKGQDARLFILENRAFRQGNELLIQ